MGRSRSTPGLVESKGKVPVSEMNPQKKEHTSASTATLLTDDEGEKMAIADRNANNMEAGDTASLASEENITLKTKDKPIAPKPMSAHQFQQVLNSQSTLIYPAPATHLLAPNVTLMNFDNRVHPTGLFPSAQIPFYAGHTQQYSPYCGLSPAVSSNHLSIPSNAACIGTQSPTNFISEDNSAASLPISSQPEPLQSQETLLSEIKRLRERLLTMETENASMSMKLNQQQWQVENR